MIVIGTKSHSETLLVEIVFLSISLLLLVTKDLCRSHARLVECSVVAPSVTSSGMVPERVHFREMTSARKTSQGAHSREFDIIRDPTDAHAVKARKATNLSSTLHAPTSGTRTELRRRRIDYQPINFFRRRTKMASTRGLVNRSASCSSVSILRTSITPLVRCSRNQWTLTS